MTAIHLTLGCLLLITSSLLLRKATKTHRWLSLCVFIIALACFISAYGSIVGVFITIAAALLIGLLTAFMLGKLAKKQ